MPFFSRPKTDIAPQDESINDKQENVEIGVAPPDSDSESIDSGAQAGVKKAEATTQAWSKRDLITVYVLIWFIYFVNTMQQGMTNALTPYVTSAFQYHSLTAAISIMSSLIGGLTKLPLAKILDIWGRPQGYALMTAVLTIGLIMMASCNNVQTYAAAQVFYWVGYNGITYTMSIFIADTSSLKNRGFMFAYASSPYLATTWLGGPLATAFLQGPGWRWGFGVFSIITPVAAMPLFFVFATNYRKAKAAGLMPVHDSQRTLLQSFKHYAIEFDVVGLTLVIAGMALFLLPFSLYSYQASGWRSPMIICMIVFGILLLIAFALYERFLAPTTFLPFHLLADRTVLGAFILSAVLFLEFYLWNSYFGSMLQVVSGLSITQASYIANIYTLGSCFWAVVVGVLIRVTGRFKWLALYFGVPLTILGGGLMIAFRQPDVRIGYIIMCQIFIAFGGGTLVICEQLAAMAATTHQYVTVVLAIESMFSSIGGAIGSTVAAAIWTGTFPRRLQALLPEAERANYLTIYGDITAQLSYAKGTPARAAIDQAYGDSQRIMLIAATSVLVLAIGAVAVWRDIKVKDFKQVKGTVV